MKDFGYLLEHFFTHRAYLPPASELPGTLFTPLAIGFSLTLFVIVVAMAMWVSRLPQKTIRRVFTVHWAILMALEVAIVSWESMAAPVKGLDLQTNLSLYPCSLILYTMPFAIWGRGVWKKMACGYVMTLGLLGALVNFIYPSTRLPYYSCISFPGFHTFFFHGSILFIYLVMLRSGYACYRAASVRELFYPCIPSLLLSVPANLINYSAIDADYMFFRGKMNVVAVALPGFSEVEITLTLYALYILIPALFYLPSYVLERRRPEEEELEELEEMESFLVLP